MRKRAEEEQLRTCSAQLPDLRYTIVRAGLLLPRPKSGTCPALVQGKRAGLQGKPGYRSSILFLFCAMVLLVVRCAGYRQFACNANALPARSNIQGNLSGSSVGGV